MSKVQNLTLPEAAQDQRLDRFIKKQFPQLSQGQVEKACRKGEIRLDGKRVKANTRLAEGQNLRLPPLPDSPAPYIARSNISEKDAEFIRSLVIYRDKDLIILNKPHGLAVQGGSKTTRHVDGLSEGLKFQNENKPHLVHRLDKDTSGVLMLARHPLAAAKLSKLFQSKRTEKLYWALVAGVPARKSGEIHYGLVKASGHGEKGEGEKMLAIHPNMIEKTEGAKPAHSRYLVMDHAGSRMAWLAMSPITGRTHQLRVHAAALGHPIIGDGKYGGAKSENMGDGWGSGIGGAVQKSLHLHARSLRFVHPFTGESFFIAAPLPPHMHESWKLMGWPMGRDADAIWEEAQELER